MYSFIWKWSIRGAKVLGLTRSTGLPADSVKKATLMQVLFCDYNKNEVLVDIKKQTTCFSDVLHLIYQCKGNEIIGRSSKILRLLSPTCMRENQF